MCDIVHTKENLVKREPGTYEQAWCGTWYDCPHCGSFTLLEPSQELKELWETQARESGYLSYEMMQAKLYPAK